MFNIFRLIIWGIGRQGEMVYESCPNTSSKQSTACFQIICTISVYFLWGPFDDHTLLVRGFTRKSELVYIISPPFVHYTPN